MRDMNVEPKATRTKWQGSSFCTTVSCPQGEVQDVRSELFTPFCGTDIQSWVDYKTNINHHHIKVSNKLCITI